MNTVSQDNNNKLKMRNSYIFYTFLFVVFTTLFFVVISTSFAYSGSTAALAINSAGDSILITLATPLQWSYISLLFIASTLSSYALAMLCWFGYKQRKGRVNTIELSIVNFFVRTTSYFWIGKTDYSVRYLVLPEQMSVTPTWNFKYKTKIQYISIVYIVIELGLYLTYLSFFIIGFSSPFDSALDIINGSSSIYMDVSLVSSGEYIASFNMMNFILSFFILYVGTFYLMFFGTLGLFNYSGISRINKGSIKQMIIDIYKPWLDI